MSGSIRHSGHTNTSTADEPHVYGKDGRVLPKPKKGKKGKK